MKSTTGNGICSPRKCNIWRRNGTRKDTVQKLQEQLAAEREEHETKMEEVIVKLMAEQKNMSETLDQTVNNLADREERIDRLVKDSGMQQKNLEAKILCPDVENEDMRRSVLELSAAKNEAMDKIRTSADRDIDDAKMSKSSVVGESATSADAQKEQAAHHQPFGTDLRLTLDRHTTCVFAAMVVIIFGLWMKHRRLDVIQENKSSDARGGNRHVPSTQLDDTESADEEESAGVEAIEEVVESESQRMRRERAEGNERQRATMAQIANEAMMKRQEMQQRRREGTGGVRCEMGRAS